MIYEILIPFLQKSFMHALFKMKSFIYLNADVETKYPNQLSIYFLLLNI